MTHALKVQILHHNAIVPQKGRPDDAGFDLSICQNYKIPPLSRQWVNTGISLAIPKGSFGRVAARSGLSAKGVDVGAGIIDCNFRGPLQVLLINQTQQEMTFQCGQKVAQILIQPLTDCYVQQVLRLDSTDRGSEWLGSSDASQS